MKIYVPLPETTEAYASKRHLQTSGPDSLCWQLVYKRSLPILSLAFYSNMLIFDRVVLFNIVVRMEEFWKEVKL